MSADHCVANGDQYPITGLLPLPHREKAYKNAPIMAFLFTTTANPWIPESYWNIHNQSPNLAKRIVFAPITSINGRSLMKSLLPPTNCERRSLTGKPSVRTS